MDVILGTILLFAVLAFFTIFNYKAPQGSKAMGALANAACASFLVEAFHSAFLGDVVGISFLGEVGAANGNAGGVAAAILVPLALGVAPGYAVLVGLSVSGMGILPGFIAGYLISFVVNWLEEKIPGGLDLIVIILVAAPLSRLIAAASSPLVDATLLQIGEILISTADASPIFMGIVLGGVLTVVATAPLSSMALTAMLGLTGTPMAIGALAVFGSSFMNYVLFSRMEFGDRKDTIAVAIEPLTQADIISANPIPIYVTNFIGGAASGIIVSLMGLVNDTPGTATPIAGFAVMFAYNPVIQVLIGAAGAMIVSIGAGFLGSFLFKDFEIMTANQIRNIGLENI